MTDKEIKELLDRLDFNEWEVDLYKVPITWCELYNIRDYITNLQTRWNSLREWLENEKTQMEGYFDTVLDKMNELEGEDKDE